MKKNKGLCYDNVVEIEDEDVEEDASKGDMDDFGDSTSPPHSEYEMEDDSECEGSVDSHDSFESLLKYHQPVLLDSDHEATRRLRRSVPPLRPTARGDMEDDDDDDMNANRYEDRNMVLAAAYGDGDGDAGNNKALEDRAAAYEVKVSKRRKALAAKRKLNKVRIPGFEANDIQSEDEQEPDCDAEYEGDTEKLRKGKRVVKCKRKGKGRSKRKVPDGARDEYLAESDIDDIPDEEGIMDLPDELRRAEPQDEYVPGLTSSDDDDPEYQPPHPFMAENREFVRGSQNLYEGEDREYGQQARVPLPEELHVGMKWPRIVDAREYLRDYAIHHKFRIAYQRNSHDRLRAKCKDPECGWYCNITQMTHEPTAICKSYFGEHTCFNDPDDHRTEADCRWVSKVIEDVIRSHENYGALDVQAHIWRVYHVRITYTVAWNSLERVWIKIQGTYEESYRKAPEICRQILEHNNGSIATVSVDNVDHSFMSLCLCFRGSIEGFIKGCRPLIGLDGCHLKGKYLGICLSAIALDGNNGLFPLAVYICKAENMTTWNHFLMQIKGALMLHPGKLTFMSDRQKGLLNAVATQFPGADHRYCMVHVYRNFKTYWRGDYYEQLVWGAAKAFTPRNHAMFMEQLIEDCPKGAEYLQNIDVRSWSRSFFDTSSKCEHISNNFSESFNFWIEKIRKRPLIGFIERYHMMLMTLIYERNRIAETWDIDGYVPRVKKVLKLMQDNFFNFKAYGVVQSKLYCIENYSTGEKWTVDLEKKTCPCNVWAVTGIPCIHAARIILPHRYPLNEYIDECHTVKAYKATYSGRVAPPVDMKYWGEPSFLVLPPAIEIKRGRRPTHRRREEDEMLSQMGLAPPARGRGRIRGRGRGRRGVVRGHGRGAGRGGGRVREGGVGRGRGRGPQGSSSAPSPPQMSSDVHAEGQYAGSSSTTQVPVQTSQFTVRERREHGPTARGGKSMDHMRTRDFGMSEGGVNEGIGEYMGDGVRPYVPRGTYHPPTDEHSMRAPVRPTSQIFRPQRTSTGKYIPQRPSMPPSTRPPVHTPIHIGAHGGFRPLGPVDVRPGMRPQCGTFTVPSGGECSQYGGWSSQTGHLSQANVQSSQGSMHHGGGSSQGSQSGSEDWRRYINSQASFNSNNNNNQ